MSQTNRSRRRALQSMAGLTMGLVAVQLRPSFATDSPANITVWKSPTCGCCNDWIQHLRQNGFNVEAINVPDSRHIRAKFGMPAKYASCHTALVGGYVVEGHVPAREVRRLLKDKPLALGISVPGMPLGSPGMDGPSYGGAKDPYDVLLVFRDGNARVFASYN